MMNNIPGLLLSICIPFITLMGCSKTISPSTTTILEIESKNEDILKALWVEIDSLESKGLYRSALQKLDSLRNNINTEHLPVQLVKAVLYKNKYLITLDEDGVVSAINYTEVELADAPSLAKPILNSILGQLYFQYMQRNMYKLQDITFLAGDTEQDFSKWSVRQFVLKSQACYKASVQESIKMDIPLEMIKNLILEFDDLNLELSGNISDLLIGRALAHYTRNAISLPEPKQRFNFSDEIAFSDLTSFLKWEIKSPDTLSFRYHAIKLFQTHLNSLSNTKRNYALSFYNLKRLKFVYRHLEHPNKKDLYIKSLQNLLLSDKDQRIKALVLYEIAFINYQEGLNYRNNFDPLVRGKMSEAFNLISTALSSKPDSFALLKLLNLKDLITQKDLQLQLEEVNIPNTDLLAYLSFRNIQGVNFIIIKHTSQIEHGMAGKQFEAQLQYLKQQPAIRKWQINLNEDDYNFHSTEIPIKGLNPGRYLILSESKDSTGNRAIIGGYTRFDVSKLSYHFSRNKIENRIIAQDRLSGDPLKDVKIEGYIKKYNASTRKNDHHKILDGFTNEKGEFIVHEINRSIRFVLSLKNDTLDLRQSHYTSRYREVKAFNKVSIFTDRSLFRPGQAVYFKVLAMTQSTENLPSLLGSHTLSVALLDPHGKQVQQIQLKTNEYGSCNSHFILPNKGLKGNYQIQVSIDGRKYQDFIQVEEYKRPNFEVFIQSFEKSYKLNDSLRISGNAIMYNGVVLNGVSGKFTVTRNSYYPYYRDWSFSMPRPVHGSNAEIISGLIDTDADGNFQFDFPLTPDKSIPPERKPFFNFQITVEITDATGETRTARKNLTASYDPFSMVMSKENSVDLTKLATIQFSAKNMMGEPIPVSGELVYEKLLEPKHILKKRYWGPTDVKFINDDELVSRFPFYGINGDDNPAQWKPEGLVKRINFENQPVWKSSEINIPAGIYKVHATVKDEQNHEITVTNIVQITDFAQSKYPKTKAFFINLDEDMKHPGDTLNLKLGIVDPSLKVLVLIEKAGLVKMAKWFNLNNSSLPIPILESDRGNIHLHFISIFNNRLYNEQRQITVPWNNKKLDIHYSRFRDQMYPGNSEEWELSISDPDNKGVSAEVLASMYDFSLDQFSPTRSWKSMFYPINSSYLYLQTPGFRAQSMYFVNHTYPSNQSSNFAFKISPELNWFGLDQALNMYPGRNMQREGAFVLKRSAAVADSNEMPPESGQSNNQVIEEETNDPTSNESDAELDNFASQVRKDFDETVFFYPSLKTDKKGNFSIRFKMKDALTKWRFRLLAHTQDFKTGYSEQSIVTRKELMVWSLPPRFLREGDQIVFPVKVSNTSEKFLETSVRLELFDGLNVSDVKTDWITSKPTLNAKLLEGETKTFFWNIRIPVGYTGILKYRVHAEGENFTDIEENMLPILSKRKLITESIAFSIAPGETNDFVFNSLAKNESSTIENHRLTLELTANPIWHALKSLPYLTKGNSACSEQVFTSFYGIALGQSIVNSNPQISEVFKKWKTLEVDAFQSELSKNSELKELSLEETPWVIQAMSEEVQKKNTALFFDENKLRYDLGQLFYKLQTMQLSNGGFPWFAGGRDNKFITQYITEGLLHLKKSNAIPEAIEMNSIDQIIHRAAQYLETEFEKHSSKKNLEKVRSIDLHYMYLLSFRPEETSVKLKSACDVMMKQLKTDWKSRTVFEQFLIALIAHRSKDDFGKTIIKSLRERAIQTEDTGIYWKTNSGAYSWNTLPIETQSLAIECFIELEGHSEFINGLVTWLLQNKRTNRWSTNKSSVSAIFALMLGTQWENTVMNTKPFTVYIGGELQNIIQSEPGTGYSKQTWQKNEIEKSKSKININNPNTIQGWGAFYWQYFEDLDKVIDFNDSSLKLEKQIYIQKRGDRGAELIQLGNGSNLMPKVGDKLIVRMQIETDRNMEFVHLKDLRASGLEPENVLSRHKSQSGIYYYESTSDVSTDFFISYLPRGKYIFEYPLRVVHEGVFTSGLGTLQSFYAPEFSSHTKGLMMKFGKK